MKYEFNVRIDFPNIDSYDGKPIVMYMPNVFTYLLTAVKKPTDHFKGKYLVTTMSYGLITGKENMQVTRGADGLHSEIKFFSPETCFYRTMTREEYKTYKEVLMRDITFNNWL